MSFKRFISVALTAAVVLSIIPGCSKKGDSKNASGSTPTATAEAKPVVIKYLHGYHPNLDTMTKAGEDFNKNRIAQAHDKNSGIDVQWEMLPMTDAETKIAMIFAGGDVPDLINLSRDNAFKYAAQGAITILDDLITKHTPEYLKITPKDVQEAVKLNGKSIAFAMRGEGATEVAGQGIIVRRDIMDELGLKDPKTLDEFVALMKTVKDKKGMIPIEAKTVLLSSLQGAFGLAGRTVIKDGKLEFAMIQPEFKDYLEFMKKLYDEGLLDMEFAVVKDPMQKILEGRAFSVIAGDWSSIAVNKVNLSQKFPQAKLDFIPYPEGKNGKKGSMQRTIYGQLTCIPSKSKEKDAAAKFINYMATEQAGNIQDYGIEGVDYKLENGKIVQTLAEQTNVTWKICYQTVVREESFPRRLKLKGYDPEYNRMAEVSKGCLVAEPTIVAPPIEKFDTKIADLDKHVNEFATKVVMGSVPLSDFNKYVQEFNAKGGKDAIDAMNAWYTKK